MMRAMRRKIAALPPDVRAIIFMAQKQLQNRNRVIYAEQRMNERLGAAEQGDGGKHAYDNAVADEAESAKTLNLLIKYFFGCTRSVPEVDLEALLLL